MCLILKWRLPAAAETSLVISRLGAIVEVVLKFSGRLALLIYILLLIAAALPTARPFRFLHPLQRCAQRILNHSTVTPGLPLFYRPNYEEAKIRGQCIFIDQVFADGHREKWRDLGRSCPGRDSYLQLFADPYETIYHRLLEDAAIQRISRSYEVGKASYSAEPNVREGSLLASLADFVCQKNQAKQILLGWRQDKIFYVTGEVVHPFVLYVDWNCDRHLIFKDKWNEFAAKEDVRSFLSDEAP